MILEEHLPYEIDVGVAARARIGLVTLASDYTIEPEWRTLMDLPGVAWYGARILNDNVITPETLRAMGPRITDTANLILPGAEIDVLAFGCTSASMALGEDVVFERLKAARPEAKTTTPITAAFAAFNAFGAKRIGVLTPYRADVNQIVANYINNEGFEVPVFGSFNQERDDLVARINGQSLTAGIQHICKKAEVDAVFVSCTSVRLADAVTNIEREIGLPVTSSNHAMAWHALRLAGIEDKSPHLGRLFEL
ncbi:MAG: maleate cis-trans isomerase family protein [Hyphomicrobiales bacterium]